MSSYDRSYYEQRGVQARALAAAALDPEIAAIHLEMAERYDLLATSEAPLPIDQTRLRLITR